MNFDISGPSSITMINKDEKNIILVGDIHSDKTFDTNTCLNFIIPDKKIDYFIEYSYNLNTVSSSTKLLRDYTKCILDNNFYFNPYLIDYRNQLPLSNLIFLFIEFQNLKKSNKYKVIDLYIILDKIQDNLHTLDTNNIKKSLKNYFNITNQANKINIKPTTDVLKFYINSLKEINDINTINNNFIKEYNNILSLLKKSKNDYINDYELNKFFLAFIKLFRLLSKITELIFDTYILSAVSQSENDNIIIHTGQQHINTFINFFINHGFKIIYTLEIDI